MRDLFEKIVESIDKEARHFEHIEKELRQLIEKYEELTAERNNWRKN
jgi:hypothetical protein